MFTLDAKSFEDLQKAIAEYNGAANAVINKVLHGEGGQLIADSVRNLMPVSTVKAWKGKPPHAKEGDSLRQINYDMAVKITSKGKYGYLYFPDDGSNTDRHAGGQHFFARGGEAVKDDIISRCIAGLAQEF